ncbi:MAG: glycerol-3-phosphate dehydrogenase [Firmicutes bacterium]|nr:glycerol-3-phosphate dehydrogenase [Bacillota bacterium]NLL87866.1 glycerol-3-phosphate dehydrogenase [Bacillota bacterium]
MSTAAIVGAGMMGSAMCVPLCDNGHEVRLVGTDLDREIIESVARDRWHPTLQRKLPRGIVPMQVEALAAAVSNADLIICGVSSFGVEWFAEHVVPLIPAGTPVLAVTKGLAEGENGCLIPYPHWWARNAKTGRHLSFNAIGGPCTSYELADRRHSHVHFCGSELAVLKKLKAVLETAYYHVSLSTDVVGIESAAALKNAYALVVTLAVGLQQRVEGEGCQLANNPQAALFGQSVREMTELVRLLGGRPESVTAGIADLFVTIFGGRTRKLGTLLGRGLTFSQAMEELSGVTLESVVITTRIARAVRGQAAQGFAPDDAFPLLMHIDEVINKGAAVNLPWHKFSLPA